MNPLVTLSAVELARRIRAGKLRSRAVVEAHIAQIEHINPTINAVVRDRFELARREADEADRRLEREGSSALPAFHGVPCTIKESFALTGMPNSSGLVARKEVLSEADAPTVAALREAGAIPLGVTNTSELCMWMESNNKVYGRTNNAYDPTRTAGGSSGGEGAVVGAAGSPFGLGSDIGGSIRMPAFFNGVFGHKPSAGLISNHGQYPAAHGDALRFHCTGPLARRAEDLFPLLEILARAEGRLHSHEELPLRAPSTVDVSKLRVLVVQDPAPMAAAESLLEAQAKAAEALGRKGAKIERISLPFFRKSLELWSAKMHAAGGPTFAELLGEGQPVQAGKELLRWAAGRSPYTLPALGLCVIEKVPGVFSGETRSLVEECNRLARALNDRLGDDGVLLYPPHPVVAPMHARSMMVPIRWAYTAIFNVLEVPVTQVPTGLDARGVPLGVQVVAAHGNDHLSLAVAQSLEETLGGWVPPPWAVRARTVTPTASAPAYG